MSVPETEDWMSVHKSVLMSQQEHTVKAKATGKSLLISTAKYQEKKSVTEKSFPVSTT